AFNTQVIQDLQTAFTDLGHDDRLHGIVLTGEGASFSAGADIQAMKEAGTLTEEQNLNDALRLTNLLHTINTCPCPVIARVNGTAMGGGLGLVAVSDIAIAAEHARFAFSEVKLGIAPAMISPYVIRKIGETNARALFVTGERFSAARAQAIGLLHAVVPAQHLDEAVQGAINELLTSAPHALRVCKQLATTVGGMSLEQARQFTAETITALRAGEEAQEGLSAFLEKRRARWIIHTH
ncbi:MAG: enoyl-CoA hydratase/isomerase family protein, partial [Ktedonobacteraceae bacterium]|nr:enoyl-CoA hydratase/isomerase family protein [Ktedonobacteraceae bacterium]